MGNDRPVGESVSLHLQPPERLLNGGGLMSDESTRSSSCDNFPNDGSQVFYRLGFSGGEYASPSPPPTSQPESHRPHMPSRCEFSADWRHAPSSSGRRVGCYVRRNYGVGSGSSHNYSGGRDGRSHSCRDHLSVSGADIYHEEGISRGVEPVRSASVPLTGSQPSSSSLCGSNIHSTSCISVSTGSFIKNGVENPAEVPILLATVLSKEQEARFRTCLQSGSPSTSGAKVKILELLEYWMSERTTGVTIGQMIAETFRDAGFRDRDTVMLEGITAHGNKVQRMTTSSLGTELSQVQGGERLANSDAVSSSSSSVWSSLSVEDAELHPGTEEASCGGHKQQVGEREPVSVARGVGVAERMLPRSVEGHTLTATACSSGVQRFTTASTSSLVPPPNTSLQTVSPRRIATSKAPTPAPTPATYKDIPRFYYPQGAPQFAGEVIVGPTNNSRENPHQKLVKGMMIPTGVYTTSTATEVRASATNTNLQVGRKTKGVAIAPLKALEDKDVLECIRREFGRLSAPPKSTQNLRSMSSNGKGFLGAGNSSQTRQGSNYKLQLIYAIQRICTQCLGLPKYFAFLILKILQTNAMYGSADAMAMHRNSSVTSSASLLTGNSSTSDLQLTMQRLWELFETHLRSQCIIRRVFVVLFLSSQRSAHKLKTQVERGQCWRTVMTAGVPQHAYLLPEDFRSYIEVLLEYHPGLAFLKQTPDFQTKYMETVIYRIFYDIDRFDHGYITYTELESSCFLDALRRVDATDDINSVLLYFSYEHFYVLYCRFWELDEDRDMLLSLQDLKKYALEDVMNPIVAERIFKGIGRRRACTTKDRISYEDFVWFCLSEEDKSTPTAIRYWFRILDLDGDGVLSVYELQTFYEATKEKLLIHVPDGGAALVDVVCQIFDMLGVETSCGIQLHDLLSRPDAAGVAFNMVTNVVRFLQFEQKDPLVAHQDRLHDGPEQTSWDRFARAEYDRMSQDARKA